MIPSQDHMSKNLMQSVQIIKSITFYQHEATIKTTPLVETVTENVSKALFLS